MSTAVLTTNERVLSIKMYTCFFNLFLIQAFKALPFFSNFPLLLTYFANMLTTLFVH